jgi:siroheme synthase
LSLSARPGRLVVVGTGPGTPDDLTQRAVRALQAADHVIEDGAVNGGLRDLGRREATFESWPDGAGAQVEAVAARVAAGQTVVVLVPGEGRETAWAGAEIVPGIAS